MHLSWGFFTVSPGKFMDFRFMVAYSKINVKRHINVSRLFSAVVLGGPWTTFFRDILMLYVECTGDLSVLGVTPPNAVKYQHWDDVDILAFTFHIPSHSSFNPWYFLIFSCSSFLMLLSAGIASPFRTALFCTFLNHNYVLLVSY